MTKFSSINGTFNEWLGDINPNDAKDYYSFGWRVGCVKMAAPRHERFDLIRELGVKFIDAVFANTDLPEGELAFMFPERHMSVHEQQSFTAALNAHKDAHGITCVDLITSSPLVIGSFKRDSIRILTWDDDNLHNGQLPST